LLAIAGCGSESDPDPVASCPAPISGGNDVLSTSFQLNPHGTAPLVAKATVVTRAPARLDWQLSGKDGMPSDVHRTTTECATQHEFDILGLYPGYANRIRLQVMNDGQVTGNAVFQIQTDPLPPGMPTFRIDKQYSDFEPAFFLLDLRPTNLPLIVDRYGQIRWYLTDTDTKYGLQIFRDGNIGWGDSNRSSVVEYTRLGEFVHEWSVQPDYYDVHHDVYEKPDGNFLVTVNKTGLDTIEDFIIELDRQSGAIVRTWDLRQILPKRPTFIHDDRDWFHANAVIFDERDNSLIISGQRQGLVKVTNSNELRWILSPPEGWAGYEDYRLNPIPSPDFDWTWGQHAPLLMPDGDLVVFDNGLGRDYGRAAKYSRIVRYRVSESAQKGGTVQQIWQYGKERGETLYSSFISDVDYLPASDSFLMTAGSIGYDVTYVSPDQTILSLRGIPDAARIIDVDSAGEVRFETTVLSDLQGASVYRSEKVDLYGND